MSYQRIIQDCAILNRVFTAFFLNECSMKDGINFEDSKPTMPQIACNNEEGRYFTEKDSPHGLKHFFHGRVEIPEFDLEKFRTMKINDFFDEDLQGKITDVARFFANAVKAHEYCDFVFSSLPDGVPFIYDCLLDPESNFRARLIIGSNLMTNTYSAVWEFYCLLMERFREVEDHPIYGKSSKAVSYMTEEERAKYNKQPVKAEQDE
jgi:hypothetical protein